MRMTKRIEVGTHEDKVGFTMIFSDDSKEHFLFSLDVAESLANSLLKVIREAKYIETQMGPPKDDVSISESVNIKLTSGGEDAKVNG